MIVDEVLAVGDAEFQRKALGKMQDVSNNDGRTVLFVSHQMDAVSVLTSRAICLINGRIEINSFPREAIRFYLSNMKAVSGSYEALPNPTNPSFVKVKVITSEAEGIHKNGMDLIIDMEINMPKLIVGMAVSFQIFNEREFSAIFSYVFDNKTEILRNQGLNKLRCIIPKCRLYEGVYYLKMHLAETKGRVKFQDIDKICKFEVRMMDDVIEWGWQKEVCVYTEDFIWTIQ
jgi:lipopolysaccharide transport system ATP-binding protein